MRKPTVLILITLLALAGLQACTTASKSKGDSLGGYAGTSDYYRNVNGVRYAWDGQQWFYLVFPDIRDGEGTGYPERWRKVDGSRNDYYHRDMTSYTDMSIPPRFIKTPVW